MMRLLMIIALLAATGCVTFGAGSTKFVTKPPGALVRVEGGGECETPCTVKFDRPREVTIAKVGYQAQRLRVGPDRSKVNVELELVAPTGEVEETRMPEL